MHTTLDIHVNQANLKEQAVCTMSRRTSNLVGLTQHKWEHQVLGFEDIIYKGLCREFNVTGALRAQKGTLYRLDSCPVLVDNTYHTNFLLLVEMRCCGLRLFSHPLFPLFPSFFLFFLFLLFLPVSSPSFVSISLALFLFFAFFVLASVHAAVTCAHPSLFG